jgi:hypothetical protein
MYEKRRTGYLVAVNFNCHKAVDTSRLWYPLPGKVVAMVRALLAEK